MDGPQHPTASVHPPMPACTKLQYDPLPKAKNTKTMLASLVATVVCCRPLLPAQPRESDPQMRSAASTQSQSLRMLPSPPLPPQRLSRTASVSATCRAAAAPAAQPLLAASSALDAQSAPDIAVFHHDPSCTVNHCLSALIRQASGIQMTAVP